MKKKKDEKINLALYNLFVRVDIENDISRSLNEFFKSLAKEFDNSYSSITAKERKEREDRIKYAERIDKEYLRKYGLTKVEYDNLYNEKQKQYEKESKKRFNIPGNKITYDSYWNYYKKLNKLLNAFYAFLNNGDLPDKSYLSSLRKDDKIDPCALSFFYVLLTMNAKKGSFINKIKVRKYDEIFPEEKREFSLMVFEDLLESGIIYERGLCCDGLNEEEITAEWNNLIIEEINQFNDDMDITIEEKNFPEKMKGIISTSLERIICHSKYGGIVYPSFLVNRDVYGTANSYHNVDYSYYCNNGSANPLFSTMEYRDRCILLKDLEKKIKGALREWEKEAQEYIYEKHMEDNE